MSVFTESLLGINRISVFWRRGLRKPREWKIFFLKTSVSYCFCVETSEICDNPRVFKTKVLHLAPLEDEKYRFRDIKNFRVKKYNGRKKTITFCEFAVKVCPRNNTKRTSSTKRGQTSTLRHPAQSIESEMTTNESFVAGSHVFVRG
jgi:hypothetical protein